MTFDEWADKNIDIVKASGAAKGGFEMAEEFANEKFDHEAANYCGNNHDPELRRFARMVMDGEAKKYAEYHHQIAALLAAIKPVYDRSLQGTLGVWKSEMDNLSKTYRAALKAISPR